MHMDSPLLSNLPKSLNYLGLSDHGRINPRRVSEFLDLSKAEIATATSLKASSVRFDKKMPKELMERLEQIGTVCLWVAEYFEGDPEKTALWFRTLNPQLGFTTPRDMIRIGRYKELLKFIMAAREGYSE